MIQSWVKVVFSCEIVIGVNQFVTLEPSNLGKTIEGGVTMTTKSTMTWKRIGALALSLTLAWGWVRYIRYQVLTLHPHRHVEREIMDYLLH